MNKTDIKKLLEEALAENESLFVTSFEIKEGNKILIEVDGDEGIPLKECIRISRHIEGNLDREIEDYSLEVTSPDIGLPLKVERQYIKNIGRTLEVKTNENLKFEGKLVHCDEEKITLEWKAREPKPIGKGKITVDKKAEIAFDEITKATVKIKFN